MRVIFLDIDGVLNAHHNTAERWRGFIGIDQRHVKLFLKLIERTGAKVVLSSTWRRDDDWLETMDVNGLHKELFIGRTDRLGVARGIEIQKYLNEHPEITQYAILDDDSDMLEGQRFFKTVWDVGLTEEICDAIVAHFDRDIY